MEQDGIDGKEQPTRVQMVVEWDEKGEPGFSIPEQVTPAMLSAAVVWLTEYNLTNIRAGIMAQIKRQAEGIGRRVVPVTLAPRH